MARPGMTSVELAGVAAEVGARAGWRVRAVHQDGPDRFRLAMEGPGREDLVLDLSPDFPRAHLAPATPAPGAPTPLAAALRNLLAGARLEGARTVAGERALEVRFSLAGLARTLWFEAFGRHGNLYVLDETGRVAVTPRGEEAARRGSPVGAAFTPVPPRVAGPTEPPPDPEGASARVARAAEEAAAIREAALARAALLRQLRGAQRKAARLVEVLEAALAAEGEAETWRRRGDLLASSFASWKHRAGGEAGVAAVLDLGRDPPEEVEVPLLPGLSAGEQVAACYEQDRKLRRAAAEARTRLPDARANALRLARALSEDDAALGLEDLRRLAQEAGVAVQRPARGRGPSRAEPWRTFESLEGWRILVGRDARGNDVLTTKEARPWDLFLHVRGASGSHVIVPTPRGKTVPRDTLLDAAELACFFSARREAERNEVDYAERRHVRKPRGAPAGLVEMDRAKTLSLRRDDARRERLLARRTASGEVPEPPPGEPTEPGEEPGTAE